MKWLTELDIWISRNIILDDVLHFSASMIITAVMYMIVLTVWGTNGEITLASLLSFMGTMAVGVLKEVAVDRILKRTAVSGRDLIADAAGALMMILIMILFDVLGIVSDPYMGSF